MDPDPVGSAFRMEYPWIRIQGYKIKGKAEFNQQIFRVFFQGNYIFQVETKIVAYLLGFGTGLKILFFF